MDALVIFGAVFFIGVVSAWRTIGVDGALSFLVVAFVAAFAAGIVTGLWTRFRSRASSKDTSTSVVAKE